MKKVNIAIQGMTCASCSAHVTKEFEKMGAKNINVNPVIVPKTGAKYAGNRFHKSNLFIVERFINKMNNPGHKGKKHVISSGHCTGKTISHYMLLEKVFEELEKRSGKNPLEVFVKAIENAAPREELVTIEYGGAKYPKAVESAPQRRVDQAMKIMVIKMN